jgi:flagellar assembly protein FliH
MGMPKKYLFDLSFDEVAVKAEPVAAPEPVEEKVTLAELEAARQAALAEGRRAALAEATDAVAARAAAALETLAKGVATLIDSNETRTLDIERQAIAALRVVVAKIAPALAARTQLTEIEALASKYLADAIDEPRVVLRVANEVYEPVRERVDAIAAASGYAGRIVLLSDEQLSGGDARIEWADGGAERKLTEQLNEVDAVMARLCDPATIPSPVPPSP